ncbi:hypothetical protein N7499_003132 [Penicillium canescens]|uniref:Uncharacterized protein n=1 Tax=Penicillium canescens TaxID=5083 RepID=A0AAD6IBG9_PENCN|nr:hypothetical protein N7460_007092 [Penicillium canescens]KAJ6093801.1 hypothetical protein N7499_003132 [Penicillium canescens]
MHTEETARQYHRRDEDPRRVDRVRRPTRSPTTQPRGEEKGDTRKGETLRRPLDTAHIPYHIQEPDSPTTNEPRFKEPNMLPWTTTPPTSPPNSVGVRPRGEATPQPSPGKLAIEGTLGNAPNTTKDVVMNEAPALPPSHDIKRRRRRERKRGHSEEHRHLAGGARESLQLEEFRSSLSTRPSTTPDDAKILSQIRGYIGPQRMGQLFQIWQRASMGTHATTEVERIVGPMNTSGSNSVENSSQSGIITNSSMTTQQSTLLSHSNNPESLGMAEPQDPRWKDGDGPRTGDEPLHGLMHTPAMPYHIQEPDSPTTNEARFKKPNMLPWTTTPPTSPPNSVGVRPRGDATPQPSSGILAIEGAPGYNPDTAGDVVMSEAQTLPPSHESNRKLGRGPKARSTGWAQHHKSPRPRWLDKQYYQAQIPSSSGRTPYPGKQKRNLRNEDFISQVTERIAQDTADKLSKMWQRRSDGSRRSPFVNGAYNATTSSSGPVGGRLRNIRDNSSERLARQKAMGKRRVPDIPAAGRSDVLRSSPRATSRHVSHLQPRYSLPRSEQMLLPCPGVISDSREGSSAALITMNPRIHYPNTYDTVVLRDGTMSSHGPEGLRTPIYSYPIQQQGTSASRIDSGAPLHVDHATLVRSPASESVDDPTSATVSAGPYRNFGAEKSFQVTQRDVAMLQPSSLDTGRLSAGTSDRRRPRENDESEIYETERPRLQLSSSLPQQLDPLEPEEYNPNKRIKQGHADMDIDIGSHIEGHIGPSSTALTTRSPTGHESRRSSISLTAPTYSDHHSYSREEVSMSKQSEGQYEPCINDTARTLPPSSMTCPPSNGKRRAAPRTEDTESNSAYGSSNLTLANPEIQHSSPKKSPPSEGSSVAAQSQSLATGNTRSNSTHTYTDIEERRYTIDKSTEGGQGSGMVHHLEDTVETQSSVGITSTFPVHESRQDVQIAPSSKSQSPATNHSGINTPDGGKSASMHDTPLDTSIGECQVPTTGLVTNNTKRTQEATPNGRKESNRAQSPHGIRMQSQENLFSDTYETFEPAKSERSTVPEQAEENNFHSLSTAGSSSARDHPSSQALNPLVPQHSHVDRLSGNSEPGSETGDNLSATIPFGAEGNMPYPDAATTPVGSFEPPRVEEAGGNNVLTSRVIDNDTTQRVVGASTSDVGQGESSEPDSTPRGSSLNEEMPQTTEGSCDRSHPSTDLTKLAPHHTTVYLHNDHPQHQKVQVHNTAMEAATGTSDGLDLEPDPPSQVTVEPPNPVFLTKQISA